MSALPPKADMVQHDRNVRFVPIADITRYPFDHPSGSRDLAVKAVRTPGLISGGFILEEKGPGVLAGVSILKP